MGNNINKNKILSRNSFGIIPSIITSYDPDFQLVIDAIQSTGVTLTTTQKNAGNTLVIDCKNNGAWANSVAFYGILGSTSGAHKWNWKNPIDTDAAFRLNFSTGWVHSNNGMLPNGLAFANTFLNSSTILTLNSTHLSYYSRTLNAVSSSFEIGNVISSNSFSLSCGFGNICYSDQYNYNTARISQSNIDARGFYIGTRTTSAIHKLFKNGSQFGTTNIGASGTFNNLTIYLGALNNNNTAVANSVKECCFVSIGNGLTDLQSTNFYNSVQAYQTTLGRQV